MVQLDPDMAHPTAVSAVTVECLPAAQVAHKHWTGSHNVPELIRAPGVVTWMHHT